MSKETEEKQHIKLTKLEKGASRLRIQFDITYKGAQGLKITDEAMVEPDMTMTIGQLLERHTRGSDLPQKTPIYFETEIPTFSDLTDIEDYKDQLAHRLKETKKFIKHEREEAKKQHQKHTAEQKKPQNTTKNTGEEPETSTNDNVPS